MGKNNTSILGVAFTIILLVILISFTNTSRESITLPEKVVNLFVMPIQSGVTYVKNKIFDDSDYSQNIDELKSKNEELLAKNSELEQQLRELEIIKSENRILKESMNLVEKYKEYESIPAEIINKDFENYSDVLIINCGEKDGVKTDMVVISDKGLVGHVISTTDYTAKVLTILDPSSSVSAKTSTTRESVVCSGNLEKSNILRLKYIPTDVTLTVGDNVETSGMGGIYPKGIHIGTITKIENANNKIEEFGVVEPAVDFDKLETVLVIKK